MAKELNQEEPKSLKPTIVDASKHVSKGVDIDLPKGKVYIVEVDKDGNELAGKGFLTTLKMWNDVYSKKPHFKLKKK